jgi:GNAT superfamily N-acetyltransferase
MARIRAGLVGSIYHLISENGSSEDWMKSAVTTMPPLRIRKAGGNNASAILTCLAAAFEEFRDQYSAGAFADTVLDSETVQRRLREMCALLAIAEGRVVGTISCSANGAEGHLRGMAVLPEWQGKGVASALLTAAEHELLGRGCSYVTLDTTEPLTRAIQFYESHGYARSGQTVDFFGMRLHEYRKALSGLTSGGAPE